MVDECEFQALFPPPRDLFQSLVIGIKKNDWGIRVREGVGE